MTFCGQPRTEAAAHASENVRSMTTPLILLAVFAIAAGWIGIPRWFPVVGEMLGNPFGTMMEEQALAYDLHAEALPFRAVPIVVSIIVSLGGIFLAWLVYGRKPLRAGQQDPLERWLGPLHPVLRKKYFFDELYGSLPGVRPAIIVGFAMWLTRLARAFDQAVIDGIVNAVGRFGRWFSRSLRQSFDELFVDGAVNGVGFVAQVAGSVLRLVQTGQAQFYLLVLLVAVLMLLALAQLAIR